MKEPPRLPSPPGARATLHLPAVSGAVLCENLLHPNSPYKRGNFAVIDRSVPFGSPAIRIGEQMLLVEIDSGFPAQTDVRRLIANIAAIRLEVEVCMLSEHLIVNVYNIIGKNERLPNFC